jgi:hypothetical protein
VRYDEEELQADQADDLGLDPKPKTVGRQPVVICSIFTLTFMICGAILLSRSQVTTTSPAKVNNEQLVLDEVDRLQREGMAAVRVWSKARRDGDLALEKQKHAEARSKLEASLETLERLLDKYRGADGYIRPEYQGYEEQLSEISVRLGDLLKGARVEFGPGE